MQAQYCKPIDGSVVARNFDNSGNAGQGKNCVAHEHRSKSQNI